MSRRLPALDGLIDPNAIAGEEPGPFNEYSCQFNGSDETINFGPSAYAYALSQPLSFSFWMKCTGQGGDFAILGKYRDGYNDDGYAVFKDSNERLSFQISVNYYPTLRVRTNNNVVTLNTWQHWTVTRQGNNSPAGVKVYRNAVELTLNTIEDEGPTEMLSAADFCIGSGDGTDRFYQGLLDEVAIWEKVLTQAEVTELYNGGVVGDLNSHSAVSSLKGWFRMGDGTTPPIMTDSAVNGYNYLGVLENIDSSNFVTDVP